MGWTDWFNPVAWAEEISGGESERGKDLFQAGGDPAYAPGGYQVDPGGTGLRTRNAGSSWSETRNAVDDNLANRPGGSAILPSSDPRNYMYGRDPHVADNASNKAFVTGAQGQQFGQDVYGQGGALLQQRTGDAAYFQGRGAQQGDFGAQNQTLSSLTGLEATQGPSAAQAQLMQGNNQAMAQQMAMARSGRGLGGNAAAMGLAQGNMAGIAAGNANAAAGLRAQEDAAWRQRQAGNLANAAGMQGQQAQTNLQAYYQNQGQNDAASLQALGLGQQAYFAGADAGQQGFNTNIAAQSLSNQIRGQEMQGGLAMEDNMLREWAARNGYNLAQQQRQDQQDAADQAFIASLASSV